MGRRFLAVIGILLVLASVFGLLAAGMGMDDVTELLRYNRQKNADMGATISYLEASIDELAQESQPSEPSPDADKPEGTASGGYEINPIQVDWDAVDDYDSAMAALTELQQQEEYANSQIAVASNNASQAEQVLAQCQANYDSVAATYNLVYPLYQKYLDLQDAYAKALEKGDASAIGLAAAVFAAEAAYKTQLGNMSMEGIIAEYETVKAALDKATADYNAAIGNLKDLQAFRDQITASKMQAESRLANAQDNRSKAQQYNDWENNRANRQQQKQNESKQQTGSEQLSEALDGIADIGDKELAVRTGIDSLMKIDGIASRVSVGSDDAAVIAAARAYLDESTLALDDELDMRQHVCTLLRLLCILCAIAGIVCVFAGLRPVGSTLKVSLVLSGLALIASAALCSYSLLQGFNRCVYALEDGSASGSMQFTALLAVLGVSLIATLVSARQSSSFSDEDAELVYGSNEDEDNLNELVRRRLQYEDARRDYELAINRHYSADDEDAPDIPDKDE